MGHRPIQWDNEPHHKRPSDNHGYVAAVKYYSERHRRRLDDVADDVRGIAATLCSLGEASGEVEKEQVRIIGESMYFMADATRDSVSKLFGTIEAKEGGND